MKKVPELRFPEFDGEWEDKNLGDVLIERNVKCKDGDYEVISSTTNGLYYQKDYFNRDIASDDKSGYKILEKEQIVFSPQNLWMGNINFNDSIDIGIVSPSYKIYDIKKNYYPYFIKHIIKTPYMMYQYLQSSEQGASVVRRNLNIELFYSCKVSIPSIEEQKKLANFFNLIDKKIEKQEKKIASIEDYKKGMMQKLFPKKGENVPELRFKGFTDPWEQREFKDNIVSIQTGTNLLGSEMNSGIPLLKMGNIQRGYFSFNKLEYLDEQQDVEEENIIQYGDFLFNTRNTLELVGKGATWTGSSGKYAFNSNIARFTFDGIDTIFFNYLYNTQQMIAQVQARAVGTTSVAAVYPRDLNSMKYHLPNFDEQKKIGKFFKELDNLITLHQRKLEELKELKKGFMQKMFI